MNNMNSIIRALVCAASLGTCATVVAQEQEQSSSWRFSLGVNWRSFGDVHFDSLDLSPGAETYLDGAVQAVGFDGNGNPILWNYSVDDSLEQVDVLSLNEITYSQGNFEGGDDDLSLGTGVVLSARSEKRILPGIGLVPVFSLATAGTDGSYGAAASVSYVGYDLGPGNFWNGAPGGGPDPNTLDMDFAEHNIMPVSPAGSTTATISFDTELELYTLACGLETVPFQWKDIALSLAAGPTLSIVDCEMERKYSAVNSSGLTVASGSDSDDKTSFRAGAFLALEIAYSFTEKLALSGTLRYDWIPVDMETSFGSIDLSGASAQVGIVWSF